MYRGCGHYVILYRTGNRTDCMLPNCALSSQHQHRTVRYCNCSRVSFQCSERCRDREKEANQDSLTGDVQLPSASSQPLPIVMRCLSGSRLSRTRAPSIAASIRLIARGSKMSPLLPRTVESLPPPPLICFLFISFLQFYGTDITHTVLYSVSAWITFAQPNMSKPV